MARKNFLVGIDVGTSNVRVTVGETRLDGTLNVVGVGVCATEGIKKGIIVDLERTIESITIALEEAERMVATKIDAAYVGLQGLNINLIGNRGVVAVAAEDMEIREEDVERVLQAARVLALPSDREIVEVVPQEYIVDGYDGIRDPVGMLGVRLEVDAMIITSPVTFLRNLIRCINRAGVAVQGMVLQSLANAAVSLSPDEMELGVFLIDLGGGTSEVSFFQQGKLHQVAAIPVGGDHITADLASGLRTSFLTAEQLKVESGCALVSLANEERVREIRTISSKEQRRVTEVELAHFIEPRVAEILQMVREEMVKMGWTDLPPAGAVLTGGVSEMHGLLEAARFYWDDPDLVRLAEPEYVGMKSAVHSTAVGILHYINRNQPVAARGSGRERVARGGGGSGKIGSLIQKIKEWFSNFFD